MSERALKSLRDRAPSKLLAAGSSPSGVANVYNDLAASWSSWFLGFTGDTYVGCSGDTFPPVLFATRSFRLPHNRASSTFWTATSSLSARTGNPLRRNRSPARKGRGNAPPSPSSRILAVVRQPFEKSTYYSFDIRDPTWFARGRPRVCGYVAGGYASWPNLWVGSRRSGARGRSGGHVLRRGGLYLQGDGAEYVTK
jgi:hypothetical protein